MKDEIEQTVSNLLTRIREANDVGKCWDVISMVERLMKLLQPEKPSATLEPSPIDNWREDPFWKRGTPTP